MNSTENNFSLTHFNVETNEVSNLLIPSSKSSSNYSTTIEGYIPEDSISPNVLIDKDNDTRVLVTNTSLHPYKCIGLLQVTFEDGAQESGTAFLVSQNVALTAAHCLNNKDHGKFISATFYPGYNPSDSEHKQFKVSHAFAPDAWNLNFDSDYDWGIIVTAETTNLGWMGVKAFYPSDCVNKTVIISGYPTASRFGYGWQCLDRGTISDATEKLLTYKLDATSGQSGAPIYEDDSSLGYFYAIGINVREYDNFIYRRNEGVIATVDMINAAKQVIEQYPAT